MFAKKKPKPPCQCAKALSVILSLHERNITLQKALGECVALLGEATSGKSWKRFWEACGRTARMERVRNAMTFTNQPLAAAIARYKKMLQHETPEVALERSGLHDELTRIV